MIPIKNANAIEKMRTVNKLVAKTHEYIKQFVKAGVTTNEIDAKAEEFILKAGAKPNFKNYCGYPATTCISVNDVVVHGIPSSYALKEGDIVSIDLGAVLDGFHGDAARTHAVGKISAKAQQLIDVTKQSFYEGIAHARAGRRLGDISNAIQTYAEKFGYGVVVQMVGHGIGKKLHEEPSIPNFGPAGQGPILKAGYTLAIEPMINEGTAMIKFDSDGWTCRTADGKLSAHYENTILITEDEPEILSL